MYAIVVFVLQYKQPWQRAAVVYTFSGKNPCICMLFDAKNSATYSEYKKINKKLKLLGCTSGRVYVPCIYMHAR